MNNTQTTEIKRRLAELEWYHTIDLGHGILTAGSYDHRPYLPYYGLPADLTGKRVLDIGAASGFFSFELERRGAQVTALDLPRWMDHDFGPLYQLEHSLQEEERYLHDPFEFARSVLDSKVKKLELNLYDLDAQKMGPFDFVFCGSLLLHLTDPIKALWRIQSVTKGVAIIATALSSDRQNEPIAHFVGHHDGMSWWFPTRACLERMVQAAGFAGWEWFSEFRLDYRDGQPGHFHGVIRAWNNRDGLTLPPSKAQESKIAAISAASDETLVKELQGSLHQSQQEVARLQALVQGYKQGRFMTLMRRIDRLKRKILDNRE